MAKPARASDGAADNGGNQDQRAGYNKKSSTHNLPGANISTALSGASLLEILTHAGFFFRKAVAAAVIYSPAKQNKMSLSLSIVVPAYNEGSRLGNSLRAIVTYLNEYAPASELIVVDDGSTDDTAAAARAELSESGTVLTSVISYQSNLGKGRAVRLGLLASRGDIALFTDADLSTPITETPKLVEPILKGECDLAFGSRAIDRSLIGVHQSWRREQGGRIFNLAVRLATGLPFWDTQCG